MAESSGRTLVTSVLLLFAVPVLVFFGLLVGNPV